MKIRVGSIVKHSLFSGEVLQGKVEGIEICRVGEKEGRIVSRCETNKHKNGVIVLDNGHWCYFYQLKELIER